MLEKVRQVQAGEGVSATLSIGVGRDEDSFEQLYKNASLALEMALSRGGDQAVVKDRVNFEFYGGRSKSTEKRTKVKSRVMANALGELIDDAKQVYVMGHKYAVSPASAASPARSSSTPRTTPLTPSCGVSPSSRNTPIPPFPARMPLSSASPAPCWWW